MYNVVTAFDDNNNFYYTYEDDFCERSSFEREGFAGGKFGLVATKHEPKNVSANQITWAFEIKLILRAVLRRGFAFNTTIFSSMNGNIIDAHKPHCISLRIYVHFVHIYLLTTLKYNWKCVNTKKYQ